MPPPQQRRRRRDRRARGHARLDRRPADRQGHRRAAPEAERGRAEGTGRLARDAAGASPRTATRCRQSRSAPRNASYRTASPMRSASSASATGHSGGRAGCAQSDPGHVDRRHSPGGRKPRDEPGAAPPAGRAEHRRVRHHQQVTEQLNKLLPAVTIPADGVSPLAQAPIAPPIVPAAAAPAAAAQAPAPATPQATVPAPKKKP